LPGLYFAARRGGRPSPIASATTGRPGVRGPGVGGRSSPSRRPDRADRRNAGMPEGRSSSCTRSWPRSRRRRVRQDRAAWAGQRRCPHRATTAGRSGVQQAGCPRGSGHPGGRGPHVSPGQLAAIRRRLRPGVDHQL